MDPTPNATRARTAACHVYNLLSVLPIDWSCIEPDGAHQEYAADEELLSSIFLPRHGTIRYVTGNLAVARRDAGRYASGQDASLEFVSRYISHFFGEESGWDDHCDDLMGRFVFRHETDWARRWRRELLEAGYELQLALMSNRSVAGG